MALSLTFLQKQPAVHRWVALRCPDFPPLLLKAIVRVCSKAKLIVLHVNPFENSFGEDFTFYPAATMGFVEINKVVKCVFIT